MVKPKKEKKALKPLIFLKEVQSQLKKASWPSRQEAIRLTAIVILISLAVAAFIGILDFSFTKIIALFVSS